MMRRIALLIGAVSLVTSSCVCVGPVTACKSDADCNGGVCVDSLCVAVDGGAMGGGTGGGGGGGGGGSMFDGGLDSGVDGGSDAGLTDAGADAGVDSGVVDSGIFDGGVDSGTPDAGLCASGCLPWQLCGASGCETMSLTFTSPSNGAVFAASASLGIVVEARIDGGLVSASGIPLEGNVPSIPATVTSGVASNTTLPTFGALSLTAGWPDAGVVTSVAFSVVSCSVATCLDFESCTPSSAGGTCYRTPLSVTFSSPSNGTVSNAASVASTVQLTLLDGGRLPTSVPVTGAVTSPFPCDAGICSGLLALNAPDGPRNYTAGWPDAGYSALISVTRDATGPVLTTFSLAPAGRPASWPDLGWRRDERVPVEVQSNEPLSATPSLSVQGVSAALTTANARCAGFPGGCPAARCDCFSVDMAAPVFNAFSGTFALATSGSDVLGNPSTSPDAGFLPVTRLRWRTNVGTGGPIPIRVAPALDSAGNLYIGTDDNGGTVGRVVSLGHSDGVARDGGFPISTGAVQSVAVATSRTGSGSVPPVADVVYANSNTGVTSGRVDTWHSADGGLLGGSCAEGSRVTTSAIALFRADLQPEPDIGAITLFNTGTLNGRVCSGSPVAGFATSNTSSAYEAPVPGATLPTSPSNIIAMGQPDGGAAAYFLAFNRQTQSFNWSSGGWTLGSSGPDVGSPAVPVALSAAGGTTFLSTASRITPVLSSIGTGTATQIAPSDAGTMSQASAAAVLANSATGKVTLVFGTDVLGSNWLMSSVADTTATAPEAPLGLHASATSTAPLVTSPVIGGGGLGASPPDKLYAVTRDGTLWAFPISSTTGVSGAQPTFTATATELFGAGSKTVYAHPTLDCNRGPFAAPNRPGTFYVVTTAGDVASVIVDSAKLSATAPWPKWQRTAGNSGSTDPYFALNPGCP